MTGSSQKCDHEYKIVRQGYERFRDYRTPLERYITQDFKVHECTKCGLVKKTFGKPKS
jgi:hypothetical protein